MTFFQGYVRTPKYSETGIRLQGSFHTVRDHIINLLEYLFRKGFYKSQQYGRIAIHGPLTFMFYISVILFISTFTVAIVLVANFSSFWVEPAIQNFGPYCMSVGTLLPHEPFGSPHSYFVGVSILKNRAFSVLGRLELYEFVNLLLMTSLDPCLLLQSVTQLRMEQKYLYPRAYRSTQSLPYDPLGVPAGGYKTGFTVKGQTS